ncbi:hypothetical protein pb186bvf_012509 [Paramecium bursaria]
MDSVIKVTTSDFHEKVNKEGKAALFFVADDDPVTGKSWCPDTVQAAETIKTSIPQLQAKGYQVFYCEVGDKDTWKNPENPARNSNWIPITGVPTLILAS